MKSIKGLISFAILLLIVSILYSSAMIFKEYNKFEYLNKGYKLSIDYDVEADINQMIAEIQQLSKELEINIVQKNHISSDTILLFSSNIEDDVRFNKSVSTKLVDNQYISNRDTNSLLQIGLLKGTLFEEELRIYSFADSKNIGLSNEFYVIGANEKQLDDLVVGLSKYGSIRINSSSFSIDTIVENTMVTKAVLITAANLIIIYLLFLLVSGLYVGKYKIYISICKLWGYSRVKIIANLYVKIGIVELLKFRFFSYVLILIGMFIVQYRLTTQYIFQFLIVIMILELLIMSTILLHIFFATIKLKALESKQGKLKSATNIFSNLVLKLSVIIVLLICISSISSEVTILIHNSQKQAVWKTTEDIYRIQVGSDAIRYREDRIEERKFSDRNLEFYKLLRKNNNGFIIDSRNFYRPEELESLSKKKLLSPNGNAIVVDSGYLNQNPIKLRNNLKFDEAMILDENVLNLFVPEKYEADEELIRQNYLKNFYFQKVTVDNIYNEALGAENNTLDIKDLSINIVYTLNNQSFFTYSTMTGNAQSQVIDPLIEVYNESIDSSYAMSRMTHSTFFKSNNVGLAYVDIAKSIEDVGLFEIGRVESVYSVLGEEIDRTKNKLVTYVSISLLCLVMTVICIFNYTWTYYHVYSEKISVKVLFGHSGFDAKLAITTILSNLLLILVAFKLLDRLYAGILICTIISAEVLFSQVLYSKIINRNMCDVVKGGYL